MSNQTNWMVYVITRINTRKPTFVTLKGPIVLSSDHSALATALLRHGPREFYWEQGGPFGTRDKARAWRRKMVSVWTNPHHAPEENEELEPGVVTDTYPETRAAFMAAAEQRRATNKEVRDNYRAKYVAPAPDPARARKTEEQKALTLMRARNRRHQQKLLVRADKLWKYNESPDDE